MTDRHFWPFALAWSHQKPVKTEDVQGHGFSRQGLHVSGLGNSPCCACEMDHGRKCLDAPSKLLSNHHCFTPTMPTLACRLLIFMNFMLVTYRQGTHRLQLIGMLEANWADERQAPVLQRLPTSQW
ncbi:hypothetical protein FOYG_03286 [Fusarium oxysporum NRRL 32931]|uniref:Uncharacterized protein n=1 Tax=Fusarium oxysporum NRRL 32931 TaxID=660029 RepID=W9J0M6_FUSOX|nr:hypothetical protein FOYG_03286 [Fusarium oxysporum NRRL 32931]